MQRAEGVLAFWAAGAEDWCLGSLDHRNDASVYCLGVLKPEASGAGFFQSLAADLLLLSVSFVTAALQVLPVSV